MDLNDLLVSYKQVRTPTKPIPAIPVIEQPIYQEAPTVKTEEPLTETADNPTTKYYISSIQAPGFKAKWNSPYKDKNKWATDLANSYRKAGITNDNAIRMLVSQDALESAWGRSAQGKFNFGNLTTGAKWKGDYVTGNDKNAKGEAIKQKFRSYNSMDEYAADKIQFLKRLYDFNENDDINKFTAKLTGSNRGKRRYAEATNYADSLTKVFNSFKKGGVIKAQTGTIMPDNTRVVKPTIQEKIQRTYPRQQQPQFVQNNRSDWERQQSYDKAQAIYNQYMQDKKTEEGLRNLNGFLTFTDYATMGLGAGSLLTKGLKWAGKKAIGQVSKQIANSRNMGIVAKPFQKGGFQSELDWSPTSWFEEAGNWKGYTQADIDALASHIPEYHEIERVTKANGTWLKLPNGKTWEGDPRSWVQLVSRNGRGLSPNAGYHGIRDLATDGNPEFNGKIFLSKDKNVAGSYTQKDDNIQHIAIPRNSTNYTIDAEGRRFDKAWKVQQNGKTVYKDTDEFAYNTVEHPDPQLRTQVATVNNVIDPGPNRPFPVLNTVSTDIIVGNGTIRKSLLGNNGNFDFQNKNIYRGLMPIIGLSSFNRAKE